jgi:hypothetical protein
VYTGTTLRVLRYALIQVVGLLALFVLPAGSLAAAPTATIAAASEVTFTTVVTSGKVNPQGKETAYRFEYLTDELFDDNLGDGLPGFADAAQTGFGYLPASAGQTPIGPVTLEGLLSGVRYHLRLVAENEDGIGAATAPDFITVAGLPEPSDPIPCFGDSCQVLPPEPVDPALGTLAAGLGNPKVRYHRYGKHRPHKKKKRQGKKKSAKGKNRAGGTARR